MQIAVFGAGGVGGYFGGLLAHAGHDVTFIARGDHLRAIQSGGLRVASVHGDFHVQPAQASDDPAAVGPVEALIVALKSYHLRAAVPTMAPLVGRETTVAPLLNGVEAPDILAEALGAERVVGGFCSVVSYIEAPGHIRQESQMRDVVLGELDGRPSERVQRLVAAFAEAGAEALQADDIRAAMWDKFLFIASLGGVSALARADLGQIRDEPETWRLFTAALEETAAVAQAIGVILAPDAVERRLAFGAGLEATMTTSMQRDVADGRRFELEAFSGAIVRMARETGVQVPVHEAIYALLRPALAAVEAET